MISGSTHREAQADPKVIDFPLVNDRRFARALWVFLALGTFYLAYRRYLHVLGQAPTSANGFGGDFWGFLHASRQIAAGHSPYNLNDLTLGIGYVYSPVVAVLLLPFHSLSTVAVFQGWTIASLVFLVAAFGLVVATEVPSKPFWCRPVLFAFAAVTALQFIPTQSELTAGQTDTIALAFLAMAALMMTRRRWARSGAFVGVAALVKTWTGGVAIAFLSKRVAQSRGARRRAFVAWVVTVAFGPLLALILGGGSELRDFFRVTFDARSQHLINRSVWGVPQVLFSHTGLAQPLVASDALRVGVTIVLAAWLVGLLVLTLRRSVDLTIGFWQVVVCVVLLLPVSHGFYCLYTLPLLWVWGARAMEKPAVRTIKSAVFGALLVCWLAMYHPWPDQGLHTHALPAVALFFADLAAVTVSVVGERWAGRQNAETLPRSRRGETLPTRLAQG
jgi:hypothetical protein